MQYCLKWDMVDQYFPWRYFVSECLRNGIFPQWNPYQHLGYAIHADPQSGVWYPIVWVLSLLRGYDLYANQFDFVFHTIAAGIGMFLFIRHLVKDERVALLTGCSYMLSGFFIGNAQHLTFIVSGCWIPFILYYYAQMIEFHNYKNIIKTSLCICLLLTGGYPAFSIILAYVLLFIFILTCVDFILKKEFSLLKRWVTGNVFVFIATIILCAGILTSIFVSLDYITRSAKLTLTVANFGAFTPQSLLSCLLPLVSAKDAQFFYTDISMSNLYFGILGVSALILGAFRKKEKKEWIILIAGLFFLLASFGVYTPVRELLYQYVPLMNLFRFPSIFRLFALICLLISASYSLKYLIGKKNNSEGIFKIVLLTFLFFYVFMIILALSKDSLINLKYFEFSNYNSLINNLNFWESISLQSLISAILIIILLLFWKKYETKKYRLLFYISLADILISAQLNTPVTVIYHTPSSVLKKKMAILPEKFPVPQNKPAIYYSDSTGQIPPLWRNLSLLRKQPGFDGYNSFKMKGYAQLADEPENFYPILKNNIVFFSDSYSFFSDTIHESNLFQSKSNHLFFSKALENKIPFKEFKSDSSAKAYIKIFKPNKIEIECITTQPQLLTLMQHDYPGWEVSIDGKPTEHFTTDYMFLTIPLPAGKHLVDFCFKNNKVFIGFLISASALIMTMLFLILYRKNHKL